MKTILITGATRGLGLEIAARLANNPDIRVIMAVRNIKKGEETARRLGKNASAVYLDLSSLENVGRFLNDWNTDLDGLVNNAGVQFNNMDSFTPDGFEETIAVNFLAAFMLTIGLEKHLHDGKVLFIGSGTHNPNHPLAKLFGYHGARYSCVRELAEGKSSCDDPSQRNRDRYATSKFLDTVAAVELARRNKSYRTFVLDPGLMPGTGLARSQGAFLWFVWKRVLPLAGIFFPDTSNPKKSSEAAEWILTRPLTEFPDGTVFSYNKKPCRHVWDKMVRDPKIGAEVYEQSLQIVENFWGASGRL